MGEIGISSVAAYLERTCSQPVRPEGQQSQRAHYRGSAGRFGGQVIHEINFGVGKWYTQPPLLRQDHRLSQSLCTIEGRGVGAYSGEYTKEF